MTTPIETYNQLLAHLEAGSAHINKFLLTINEIAANPFVMGVSEPLIEAHGFAAETLYLIKCAEKCVKQLEQQVGLENDTERPVLAQVAAIE